MREEHSRLTPMAAGGTQFLVGYGLEAVLSSLPACFIKASKPTKKRVPEGEKSQFL